MKDITLVSHLSSLSNQPGLKTQNTAPGFTEMLTKAINDTNETQVAADQAIEKLSTGEEKNIHNVMITMEKADISLRMFVQMRNKVVEAYEQIMRMQV